MGTPPPCLREGAGVGISPLLLRGSLDEAMGFIEGIDAHRPQPTTEPAGAFAGLAVEPAVISPTIAVVPDGVSVIGHGTASVAVVEASIDAEVAANSDALLAHGFKTPVLTGVAKKHYT